MREIELDADWCQWCREVTARWMAAERQRRHRARVRLEAEVA